jgi:hypothetical protein
MSGFRLRDGAVQMRRQMSGAGDSTFGCDSGRWEALTTIETRITRLLFSVTSRSRNAHPAKNPNDPCVTGDPCRETRVVEIQLTGTLAHDPNVGQSLTSKVAVRNDRYQRL